MRYMLVAVALLAVGCGSSTPPVAPTPAPLPSASIVISGSLTIEPGCLSLGGNLFQCSYHGTAENIGAGCGASVSGVTKSFFPTSTSNPLDSNQWRYTPTVRPHELFVYQGFGLKVPSVDGWTYSTTFAWTDVRCP